MTISSTYRASVAHWEEREQDARLQVKTATQETEYWLDRARAARTAQDRPMYDEAREHLALARERVRRALDALEEAREARLEILSRNEDSARSLHARKVLLRNQLHALAQENGRACTTKPVGAEEESMLRILRDRYAAQVQHERKREKPSYGRPSEATMDLPALDDSAIDDSDGARNWLRDTAEYAAVTIEQVIAR